MKKKKSLKLDLLKTNEQIKQTNNENQQYFLTSALIRSVARIIDFVCLFFICFFSGVGFFYIGINQLNLGINYGSLIPMLFGHDLQNISQVNLQVIFIGWKYCVFACFTFVVFSIWFLFIPYIWKGRTIGKAICKITTVNLNEQNKWFFWRLIQKEFFIWILMLLIFLIYGFVCLSLNKNAYKFNINYINSANTNGYKSFNTIYVFVFLFSMNALIQILFFLWMCFKNNKRCLQDDLSNTVVVYTTNQQEQKLTTKDIKYDPKKEHKYVLPGEVNLKEIDKLTK